jgi:two-component sensor histidine kinase
VEAISNACKHGLAQGGALSVIFRVREGQGDLTISDTGCGGQTARLGVGVGRTLMTAFARQLRGEATFKANPDGGLTARLLFPLPEAEEGIDLAPERVRALNPSAIH